MNVDVWLVCILQVETSGAGVYLGWGAGAAEEEVKEEDTTSCLALG